MVSSLILHERVLASLKGNVLTHYRFYTRKYHKLVRVIFLYISSLYNYNIISTGLELHVTISNYIIIDPKLVTTSRVITTS